MGLFEVSGVGTWVSFAAIRTGFGGLVYCNHSHEQVRGTGAEREIGYKPPEPSTLNPKNLTTKPYCTSNNPKHPRTPRIPYNPPALASEPQVRNPPHQNTPPKGTLKEILKEPLTEIFARNTLKEPLKNCLKKPLKSPSLNPKAKSLRPHRGRLGRGHPNQRPSGAGPPPGLFRALGALGGGGGV